MSLKVIWVWVVICAMCGLAACTLAKVEEPIVVSKVKEEFEVSMWEKLSPEGPSFQLIVETLDETPCQNTLIATRSSLSGNILNLSLLDIAQPEDCNPGSNPAHALIDYGRLPTGYYRLHIDLKETVENEGNMVVYEDRYELNMSSMKGLELSRKLLRRVPEGAIWGYIAYEDASEETAAQSFSELLDAYTSSRNYPAGDYGYYRIENETRQLVLPEEPAQAYAYPFIMHFSAEDIKGFKKDLKELRETAPDGVTLVLNTWQGENW